MKLCLSLKDGEQLHANLCFADLEYQDIVVNVLQTNQPEHYKDPDASYSIPAAEVLAVEAIESPKQHLSS